MSQLLRALVGLVAAGLFFGLVMFAWQKESIGPVDDRLALASLNESRRPLGLRALLEEQKSKEGVEDVTTRVAKPSIPIANAVRPARRAEGGDDSSESMATFQETHVDVEKAIRMIDNGDVDGAMALLEDVLKDDPTNEQALVEMAMINLLDLRRPGQAIDYLQRVIEVNPANRVVMTELVSLYEEEGRIDEGLQFMLEAQQANPDSGEIAYGVGQMMVVQGRDQDAIPYLRKAAEQSENPVRAGRELAEALARAGDAEQSVVAYQDAIKLQEDELKSRTTQGMPTSFAEERLNYMKMDMVRKMIELGQWEDAERVLSDVQDDMPGDQTVISLAERIRDRRQG